LHSPRCGRPGESRARAFACGGSGAIAIAAQRAGELLRPRFEVVERNCGRVAAYDFGQCAFIGDDARRAGTERLRRSVSETFVP